MCGLFLAFISWLLLKFKASLHLLWWIELLPWFKVAIFIWDQKGYYRCRWVSAGIDLVFYIARPFFEAFLIPLKSSLFQPSSLSFFFSERLTQVRPLSELSGTTAKICCFRIWWIYTTWQESFTHCAPDTQEWDFHYISTKDPKYFDLNYNSYHNFWGLW